MGKGSENLDFGKKVERLLWGFIPKKINLENLIKNEEMKLKFYESSIKSYENMLGNPKILYNDTEFHNNIKNTEASPMVVERIIREHQPGNNPTEPYAEFASAFYDDLTSRTCFDSSGKIDKSLLHYYTALDTHLDFHMGTDFFLEKFDDIGNDQKILAKRLNIDFKLRKDGAFNYSGIIGDDGKRAKADLIIYMKSGDGEDLEILFLKRKNLENEIEFGDISQSMKDVKTAQKIEARKEIVRIQDKYFNEWNKVISKLLIS